MNRSAFVGVGEVLPWIIGYSLLIVLDALISAAPSGSSLYFSVGLIVAYVAAAAIPAVSRLIERRCVLVGACVLGSVSSIALYSEQIGLAPIPKVLLVVASIALAVVVALFFLRLLLCFVRYRMTTIVVSLAMGHLVAAALATAIVALTTTSFVMLVSVCTPWLVLLCDSRMRRKQLVEDAVGAEEPARDQTSEFRYVPWRPFVLLFAINLMTALSRQFFSSDAIALSFLGAMLCAAVVVLVMLFSGRIIKFKILYNAALFFIMGGFAILPLGGWAVGVAAGNLVTAGYVAAQIFVIALLCSACSKYHVNALTIFSVLQAVSSAGYLVGAAVPLFPQGATQLDVAVFALVLSFLTCVVFTLLLTDDDYRTSWGIMDKEPDVSPMVSFYYSIGETCSLLAQQCGLTHREEEVMLLLAQRKSTQEIEQELCISSNTVKSHSKNIYRKLGIHKREELLELVGHPSVNGRK